MSKTIDEPMSQERNREHEGSGTTRCSAGVLPRELFQLGKHEGSHPATVQRVLGRLETSRDDDEAHDVIAALYWRTKLLEQRYERYLADRDER